MSKFLKYTAALVGAYLLIANATNAGKLFTSGASAYSTSVKALQGR